MWDGTQLTFFSGGAEREAFVSLFDGAKLKDGFRKIGVALITVYGEAYGGKLQGMSKTYGDKLKFIAFDVKICDSWLETPKAEQIVIELGLEFVPYILVDTSLDTLNIYRDLPSAVAIRNGIREDKMREGIVLRSPIEVKTNNGQRIIAKHKCAEFSETRTPRIVGVKTEEIKNAQKIADEYVTEMRLTHVLEGFTQPYDYVMIPNVLRAMKADLLAECAGEFSDSKQVWGAIGRATVKLFKERVKPQNLSPLASV
jgi:hypothetical protein